MSASRDKHPPKDWKVKITDKKDKADDKAKDDVTPSFNVTDRRFWASEGEGSTEEEIPESIVKPPAYVLALEEEIKKKDETLKEYIAQYKSAKGQMNEAILRIEREKAREVNFRIAELAKAFISILDDLYVATETAHKNPKTESLAKGFDLIASKLSATLKEVGVVEIEAIGKAHDPRFHEAIAVEPVDSADKDGIIISEMKKGYMLGDVLVRPSMVLVGRFEETTKGE